MTVAVQDI